MIRNLTYYLPEPLKALAIRFDKSPLDTVERITEFAQTRSSYVAQTALYGYLKTRMGTRFRSMFEDEVFSTSIHQAAIKVFMSCLCDMIVFAAATANAQGNGGDEELQAMSLQMFDNAVEKALSPEDRECVDEKVREEFASRLEDVCWQSALVGENAFSGSAADLIRYAPVIDEFKELDEEIVSNSIRFRWQDVRAQYRKRVDGAAVLADWRRLN